MRSILYCIFLASATMMLNACGSSEKKSSEKKGNDSITSTIINEDITYTELSTMPLPCSKEKLYTAWKQIGVIEAIRKKNLDYKQHTPVFFISTDLDKDGNCEVLLRGEPPYAAIFSYLKDSPSPTRQRQASASRRTESSCEAPTNATAPLYRNSSD